MLTSLVRYEDVKQRLFALGEQRWETDRIFKCCIPQTLRVFLALSVHFFLLFTTRFDISTWCFVAKSLLNEWCLQGARIKLVLTFVTRLIPTNLLYYGGRCSEKPETLTLIKCIKSTDFT